MLCCNLLETYTQIGAGQGRAVQGRPRYGRIRQGRAGQGRAGQGRAGQGRAGQGRAGQGRAGQGRAGTLTMFTAASEMDLLEDCLHGRNTTLVLSQAHLHDSPTKCN